MVWNHGMLSGEVKPGQVLLESAERQFSSSRWLTKSCACHAKWHERPRQDRTWRRRTDADQTLPRKVTYHAPQNCTKPPNTALGTKKDSLTHVPRLPSLPQNVALSPPDASLPMRLAKTTRQHHTSAAPATKNGHGHLQTAVHARKVILRILLKKVLHLSHKMTLTLYQTHPRATKCRT